MTPESLELFSAHSGVFLHSIELQNPCAFSRFQPFKRAPRSSSDVVVEVSIARSFRKTRRLSEEAVQELPRCEKPSRLGGRHL